MTVWRIFSFLTLVTPLFCLILGLICWRYPHKGPTWLLGYRSRRARASQEAWQFAQNVAGQIWFGLGLVQTVVFAWVCLGMQTWSVEAQCQAALISILVEDVLVLLSMIPTEVLLVRRFGRRSASRPSRDRRGTR
ncbi:MAG: SdpI family protein [Oscillospiraceae bacterium]